MARMKSAAKNLLFAALCLFGIAAIASGLRPAPELVDQPAKAVPLDADVLEAAAKVDAQFEAAWSELELEPAGPAPTMKIARRISLGLTGTIPSLEELRALELRPPEQRIPWWIERTLDDPRFHDYVAERFARVYVGAENGRPIVFRRRRFVSWLSDSLEQNTPYDRIVRALIADEGIWTSSPAVNFLTVTLTEEQGGRPDPVRLAGRVSRAFLGMRIDCLQCHDDRLGNVAIGEQGALREGLQQDFHQLAAFFSQTRISPLGVTDGEGEYQVAFLGEEEETKLNPAIPFRADLLPEQGRHRERLATWVTDPDNKAFARVTVNRVWALLFGKPLVEPIDDIPLEGPYPPGLELLADDFAGHGFDLRRLIRVIIATRVFQFDSQADHELTNGHEMHWAAFPLTRLRPEQVAGAVIQSASVRTIDADSHILFQFAKFIQTNEFVKRYGDIGEDEFEERAGTIAQRLLMMNGNMVRERTKADVLNASAGISGLAPTDEIAVETAYLTALSRRPSEPEIAHFVEKIRDNAKNRREQVIEDILWALLNSTEFSWNH